MKIILSPSKEMEIKAHGYNTSIPAFISKQTKLYQDIQSYSVEEIISKYKVSSKLANQVMACFNETTQHAAIFLYNGLVFRQLQLFNYNTNHIQYMQNNIMILSSMYGAVKPLDCITTYRLDQKTDIGINLYDYWKLELEQYFKSDDIIISLASLEYEKMIHHKNIIKIDFVEQNEKGFKRSSAIVKKARGQMLDYIIVHEIQSIDDLKKDCIESYYYSPEHSTNDTLTYIKKAT